MGYLHTTTRLTITAPISTWQEILEQFKPITNPNIEGIYYAVETKLTELRTQQGRRTNASWDYDYPISIDNLTPDESAIIQEAWYNR